MKILYCDLRPKWTIKGHRNFDVKWCHLLSNVADVTLLCPEMDWYKDVDGKIDKIIYNATDELKKRKWYDWKIWNKGNFRRLAVRDHAETNLYIKKVLELNKEKSFDYILIGALDIVSYLFYRRKLTSATKLVLIEHSADAYTKGILNRGFLRIKNDFIHIVMEKDAVKYFSDLYGINKDKIVYIPHMLNTISAGITADVEPYDVVGISNSNDDNELQKIINLEENERFFEKMGLRAIFRSKNIEYTSTALKIFKGRLGLSYEEYYTYVTQAKVMVLPFSEKFGLRSSGTIVDAFSQNIPIIGNPFKTMIQYNRIAPHICKLYTTMDELKEGLMELIEMGDNYHEEYRHFQETHSNGFIVEQIRKTFV